MESVAAERLNKIGKNPSIVSNRENFEEDINLVNELIYQKTSQSRYVIIIAYAQLVLWTFGIICMVLNE